jgi:hypothetical protein
LTPSDDFFVIECQFSIGRLIGYPAHFDCDFNVQRPPHFIERPFREHDIAEFWQKLEQDVTENRAFGGLSRSSVTNTRQKSSFAPTQKGCSSTSPNARKRPFF